MPKYDTRISKYGIEIIVALSSTNATKILIINHEFPSKNGNIYDISSQTVSSKTLPSPDLETDLYYNPLPHMPNLGSSHSAAIKDTMSKCGQKIIQLSDRFENIVGKGEIARYEQFLLFPQSFHKVSVVDASK